MNRKLISQVFIVLLCSGFVYLAFEEDAFGSNNHVGIHSEFFKYTSTDNEVSPIISRVISSIKSGGIFQSITNSPDFSIYSNPLVRVAKNGGIHTYIYLHTGTPYQQIEWELKAYEVQIELIDEQRGIMQAWIPFDRIDEVGQLSYIIRITPPDYSFPQVGSVTTEGDAILRADELRSLGIDGTGVKVGVISDGVDNIALPQATGDLPAVQIVTLAGSGDEGTAMLEILHDLAPKATLGFCGARTSLEFIQCVRDLDRSFNADIIVDDLAFFLSPYFEDGLVANQVKEAVRNGVLYVSAAGNHADSHYEADFLKSEVDSTLNLHDFGKVAGSIADPDINVLVGPGESLTVVLQWNDPFGASGNDYDLLLVDEFSNPLRVSEAIQNGDDDPIEALTFTNPFSTPFRVKVLINKFSGIDRRLEIYLFSKENRFRIEEYNIAGGSVFGHAAVPGALAVGAIRASNPGNDDIEPFSSRGPSEIFFPAHEIRRKPDLTGIDGVSVTGVGGFSSPFFGTSAAAPHVAGVAALLMSAFPTTSATQIITGLKNSAIDLGIPGEDLTFGAGRVDAVAAFRLLTQPLSGVLRNISYNGPVGTAGIKPAFIVDKRATFAITAESDLGVQSPLPNPLLMLRTISGTQLEVNDDCSVANLDAHIGRPLTSAQDACVVITLDPGAYVAEVRDAVGASGNAIVSATTSIASMAALRNISYNGPVGTAGIKPAFIVDKRATFAITAESDLGVQSPLPNPLLMLRTISGTQLEVNDDCSVANLDAHIGRSLTSAQDACVVITLDPGAYVAEVRDAGGASGNAIVSMTRSAAQ